MDDSIRASDADRERVTARLRDHYAEGRLTAEELDERTSAALNAKTFGELRRVMADLPDPLLMPAGAPGAAAARDHRAPPWLARARRGPRFAPAAHAGAALRGGWPPGPGAWALLGFFKLFLLFWAGDRPGGVSCSPRRSPAPHVPGRARRLPAGRTRSRASALGVAGATCGASSGHPSTGGDDPAVPGGGLEGVRHLEQWPVGPAGGRPAGARPAGRPG